MDDADRASIYEQAALEAALARQRAERPHRRYSPLQRTHCELCGGEIEPQRQAWHAFNCASCARDAERWQR
jgi:RNA polymerase-binding transcription factor DksA